MRKLILGLAVIAIAVACNKDQKAVRTLDGEWTLIKRTYTEDGLSVDETPDSDESETIAFSKCKLKKDEFCDVSITFQDPSGSETENYMYKVKDDGETLVLKITFNGIAIEQDAIIEELSKDELSIKIEFPDGSSSTANYEKR